MTWIVMWHDGGGSMVEAANPTELWTFDTEAEATEMDDKLSSRINGSDFTECWVQSFELPAPTKTKTDAAVAAFLQEYYPDEYQEYREVQARLTAIQAVTANGAWIVFEDTDPANPPEVEKLSGALAFEYGNRRFGPAGQIPGWPLAKPKVYLRHKADPKTLEGGTVREVSLWCDGVRVQEDTVKETLAKFLQSAGSNFITSEGSSMDEALEKARGALKERRRESIEPLPANEIPDDVLRSLGDHRE
jgi:hypothetical protein